MDSNDQLSRRIADLETKVHWWRMSSTVAIAVLATMLLMGARRAPEKVVSAERFELLAPGTDNVVAELRSDESFTTLDLLDRKTGDARASLSVSKAGPMLLLTSGRGLEAVRAGVLSKGSHIDVRDEDGKTRTILPANCVTTEPAAQPAPSKSGKSGG
jgi:hypothetical protein